MVLKAKTMVFAFLCFASFVANATNEPPTPRNPFPEMNDWIGQLVTEQMNDWMNDYPSFTDEEYEQRLIEMSGAINYKLHPMVKEVIVARTEKYRSSTEQVLGLSDIYFPIFEEHLAKYNLPHQLKYLPIIESRLEPVARSYAGAVGLWQFIPSTGKLYNLQISSTLDERSNTYKASDAAARMLSELYKYYNDWALALAAYNCGPGRINRAIKDAGSSDYWVVRNFLPTETQRYVPYFMAVVYVGEYHYLHELEAIAYPEDLVLTDTIMIHTSKSLYDLAKEVGMSPDTVRKLNPGYLKSYVPASANGSVIVLPNRVVAKLRGYEARYKEIMSEQTENPVRSIRRVNSAEDVAFLARAYRCSTRDIMYWNGFPENYVVQPGDVVAMRKYKPSAEIKMETRKHFEPISMPSLQVVGLDKKTGAVTEPVYASLHSSLGNISDVAMTVPQKVAANSAASNMPVMPSTTAVSAMLHNNNQETENSSSIQKVDEAQTNGDALARPRERRIRGAMMAGDTENTTQPEAISATEKIEENRVVAASVTESASPLAQTQEQADALMTQQKNAENTHQQQLEQQSQQQLADKLGQQASSAIAARQTAANSTENVTTNNVVMGIVPVAAADEHATTTTNLPERNRERNLRCGTAVENTPIVAVSTSNETQDYIYYTTEDKETIWDVRNRFPQMTVRDILELNQLPLETELRAGMQLKIRR